MCSASEQKELLDSVERGWHELRSGLGEFVAEDDEFFASIRKEIRNEKRPLKRSSEYKVVLT
jgi:hypothetical protein